MKLKYIYLLLVCCVGMLVHSCDDGLEVYDGIYITETLNNSPTVSLRIADDFPKSIELTVASTNVVSEDITIELAIDESKVEEYNKKFGANYLLLPKENVVLTHPVTVVKQGDFATKDPVRVNIIGKEGTVDGEKYMIPVSIKRTSGSTVIEASRTIYVLLDQIIVTSALDLGGGGYLSVKFWEGNEEVHEKYNVKALDAVTFEMRVFINSYNSLFNTIMGLEENMVLRINSENNNGGKLDCAGGSMGNIMNTTPYPLGRWSHVAMTYDSNTMIVALYIDGNLVGSRQVDRAEDRKKLNLCASYEYGKWSDNTALFYIGNSALERGGRHINGKLSEARVWAKALTQSEIRNNACYVNPASEGLLGYWRLNDDDPSVKTFEDLTGNGFTATLHGWTSSKWLKNIKCPEE